MSRLKDEIFERVAPLAVRALALAGAATLAAPVVLLAVLPVAG